MGTLGTDCEHLPAAAHQQNLPDGYANDTDYAEDGAEDHSRR
jgi:hypothetical protein